MTKRINSRNFDSIEANPDWAFADVRSTEQWTHGYHRYPAKFLPNVVQKLIETYSQDTDVVADLFAGCGTTLVEAKVHGRRSVGTDINPIATLITRVKTTPISPALLESEYQKLVSHFVDFEESDFQNKKYHERLEYWFRPTERHKIAYLYQLIDSIQDNDAIREFFLVAVSHILKNCSWWLQSSTKPQRDPNKHIADPFNAFTLHCQRMIKGNQLFYDELFKCGYLDVECEILDADARHVPIEDESVNIVITSPPYVTSYEYADIHQLTGYWMEYFSDISTFRKLFIGTSYSGNRSLDIVDSEIGKQIVSILSQADVRLACDVANYFCDMQAVAKEMFRILKKKGYACIVIGNTTLKNVHVRSAEVFYDFLRKAGFKKVDIIKRNIPNKLMPTLRDKVTGKFTTLDNKDCKRVYPDEYIIIVSK